MPNYEMMAVIDGQLSDEDIDAQLSKLDNLITSNGGEITVTDNWGKRRMAYPVSRKVDGFYAVRQFTHPGAAKTILTEIERAGRIEEALLRQIVIRIPKTKKVIPALSKPEAYQDSRPDWGGARRGWRPPRPERSGDEEGGGGERYERRPWGDRDRGGYDRGPRQDRPAPAPAAAAPEAGSENQEA